MAVLDKEILKREETIRNLFNYFDTDRSGYLTIMNLKEIFARSGSYVDISDIK